ncbi:MAG: Gfo/Idh/MocA family oxidoreductase [Acidobacteriaceae bacterium]|nr:Gfo/Idh/MocA family oxidoreductase [Acidobacteriaceae bacterium]
MSNAETAPKIRWGVLGVAGIAVKKVIPAMQRGARTQITAIASRDRERAEKAAAQFGIPKAYGSYEELLGDPEIDAIYNPLPNDLHVPWSVKAAEAGKHVLCEKPIALTAEEARTLIQVRDATGVKMGEAFMVRTHPQWLRARELVRSEAIGDLKAIMSAFSYFNIDPKNIRNLVSAGGGGLMDIGCYPITMARFLFGREPKQVVAAIDRDPEMGTDRLTSALLDFAPGQAIFTCSTQLVPFQRTQILGTRGRIEIEIPYNAPPDQGARILIDDGSQLAGKGARAEEFPVLDQYTLQGDLFSQAIQENGDVAVPIEDAVANMAVIDALFRSAQTGRWERP